MEHDCTQSRSYTKIEDLKGNRFTFSRDNILEILDEAELIQKDSHNDKRYKKWTMDFETAIGLAFRNTLSTTIHPKEIKYFKKIKERVKKHLEKNKSVDNLDISNIK